MSAAKPQPLFMLGDIPVLATDADHICVQVEGRPVIVPSEIAISPSNDTGRAYILSAAYYADDQQSITRAAHDHIARNLAQEYAAKNVHLVIE